MEKIAANAVKGSNFQSLKDLNAGFDDLKKQVDVAEKEYEQRKAAVIAAKADLKAEFKATNEGGRQFEEANKALAIAEKAVVAAQKDVTLAEGELGRLRSAFLAAEKEVERQANAHKAAVAAEAKAADKLGPGQKSLARAQAEHAALKDKISKADATLKRAKDDKGALKSKAEAEKEIRKVEDEVKKADAAVMGYRTEHEAAKAAVKRAVAAILEAKRRLTEADTQVEAAQNLVKKHKSTLTEAQSEAVSAGKARDVCESAVERNEVTFEQARAAIPVAEAALWKAMNAQADARTEWDLRQEVEAVLADVVKRTESLVKDLSNALHDLEKLDPITPIVDDRLSVLQSRFKPLFGRQSKLEKAGGNKALAGMANELDALVSDLNSLAGDTTKLIDDAPGLRDTYLTAAMKEFYQETIKSNLKDHVSADKIDLPKTLKAAIDTAAASGWTASAKKSAEKDLSDKIKAKIDSVHLAAVEVINIRALGKDDAFEFLTGSIAVAGDLARETGMTLARARQKMTRMLAAQMVPSEEDWRAYFAKKNILAKEVEKAKTSGGYVTHITILTSAIVANPNVDLNSDDAHMAATKLFSIGDFNRQIHATIESNGPLNKCHYYIDGTFTGGPNTAQKKALDEAMTWWINTRFAPAYNALIKVKGGFHALK